MGRAPNGGVRARPRATRGRAVSLRLAALAAVAMLALDGCAKQPADETEALGFQFDPSPDSAALARGEPLLREFEPYRASDGALRARGRFALPDGARLQISVRRRSDGQEVAREQVLIISGGFDTPPMPSHGGPLPEDDYRFEIRTEFNRVWQPENVISATRSGLSLTGPGMGRGIHGEAIYRAAVEKHL